MKRMRLGWKKLRERSIRINKWRSMKEKRFRLPNGRKIDFYVHDGQDIVCTLVIDTDGRVVIAKQFRPGPEKIMTEMPGGGVDEGETPRAAAIREVREETGYVGKAVNLGTTPEDGWSEKKRHHFLMTESRRVGDSTPDDNEAIEVETVSMKKFLKLVHRGHLSDFETAIRGLMYLSVLTGLPKKKGK